MALGDLISIPCVWGVVPYRHYGVDIGDGSVVHLATDENESSMRVQRVAWDVFADGKSVRVESVSNALPSAEVVERAIRSVGLSGYHLALGNCEHFARACKTGDAVSHQADRVIGSFLRAGLAGMVSCSARAATFAAAGGLPRMAIHRAAGVASVVGEVARQSAYAASRRCSLEHQQADRIGKTAGTIAAALTGTVAGGPTGGLASAALYVSIDHMAQRAFGRWRSDTRRAGE
ncbi:MAG: lecithin retinol acyltransferase family protein [Planctomycetota bacterium]|jgi:hypothetical protein